MAEQARRQRPTGAEAFLKSLLAGSCASSCATLVSNPFEVVKTRMQLQGELGAHTGRQYSGPLSAFRAILMEEGMRGIQAGLAPAIAFQVRKHGANRARVQG
jgi:solute carrier family 25, member 34/35